MKITENSQSRKSDGYDWNRYPIASDTYQLADDPNTYYQECLVTVNDKWFAEIYFGNQLAVIELNFGEVNAWLDASKDNARFKRSVFANRYFTSAWEVL